MDMKIGFKSAVFWLGLLASLFITNLGLAQNHTDFIPVSVPSPHIMESSIAFGQDQQGQTWLVTERGISVFRDFQFVSFRSLDFGSAIVSAQFVGNEVFVATQHQVFRISLADPSIEPILVWPLSPAESQGQSAATKLEIIRLEKALGNKEQKQNIFIYEKSGIHQLSFVTVDDGRTVLSNLIRAIEVGRRPTQILAAGHHLFLLFNDIIEQYSSLDNSWQSFGLGGLEISNLAVVDNQVLLLPRGGELQSLDLNSGKLEQLASWRDVTQLVQAQGDVFLRQGDRLTSFVNPKVNFREANFASNVFVDGQNNVWLSTPFDIQVSWWQPIAITSAEIPPWGNFVPSNSLSRSGDYAVKQGVLYQRQRFTSQAWQPIWQLQHTRKNDELSVLETQNHIWLVAEKSLTAVNKASLTISYQTPLKLGSQVFEFNQNSVILFTADEVSQISGEGRVEPKMTQSECLSSCLLPWQVSSSIRVEDEIYLGTNQGLFSVNTVNLAQPTARLDLLNQLTPVLSVEQARQNKLWIVYPNKVALFNPQNGQSQIFYSGLNRVFDARVDEQKNLVFNSQRGWFRLSADDSHHLFQDTEQQFVVQQVIQDGLRQNLRDVGKKLSLGNDTDQIQLAFNIAKQHPSQQLQVRFRYDDEQTWSVVSMFNQSLTLKNLRQGANQLEIQARLEGLPWQHAKTINYILPYQFFQTKWVVVFVATCLILLLVVIVYERLGRVKVAFNSVTQEAFILSLLDSTKDGVWIANKDREIQTVNQAFVDITGYQLDEVSGKSFQLHADFGRNHELESLIWQEVIKNGFWVGEVWSKKHSGEKVSLDLSVTRVETENRLMSKTDVKFVGVFSDITHRKNSERELRLLATRDPLTNLPNRTLFIEHVQHTIDVTTPMAPNFAILFLDLDNFKKVNESLGPLKGDEFIGLVAERIAKCLPKGITLARLGGDEFAILIPNQLFSGVPAFFIKRVAKDIQRELMPAFWLDDTEISISASMGASIYPSHGDKPEILMRCADTALNRVKITGRNNCLIYDDVMDDLVNDKLSLESELIAGLNRKEFLVYYQPKFRIKENDVCGFEALVRWQNPNRGLVAPDQFISIAEDNGIIRQLDFHVLESVCQQIQVWLKSGVMRGKVAVNISALNFQQADFCEGLIKLIEKEGALWNYIELEITETAMMRDPDRALKSAETLRAKGLSIALDDFGTGHSSLGYLKNFPIDRIKIDRTFVKDIEFDEQDRNITSVIVQLAKHLGIEVIAEGIETETQAYLMHVMGCNEIQGYFISRPVPADQVPKLLASELKTVNTVQT